MSRRQIVEELHKPARKNFKRQRVIIRGIDDLWQADLVDMSAYSSENQNFRFLLTVIDTFTKYAWSVPIKRKSAAEVVDAMQSIFHHGRIPKNLQTDDGKEFFNKSFQKLMKIYDINHYSSYSPLKASIVERYNKTLKNMMWKEFSMNGNYRWISMLDKLTEKYNNTKHRTIKMRPVDVRLEDEKRLLAVYQFPKIKSKPKFKVGDFVRISKHKHVFEKGYTPNWSAEIFKIKKVIPVYPTTYILEDYQGNIIQGKFYELELAPVKNPDVYLVEKIVKKRGNRVFVKWLGFSTKHNSWINIKDVL